MYIILVEIPEGLVGGGGWGGLFLWSKNGNSGEEGGLTQNSLRGEGMDVFWNHTHVFIPLKLRWLRKSMNLSD